jgi:hypothetical protein
VRPATSARSRPDRWWSEADIAVCRTIANLADQTLTRLHADMLVRERLRDEEFTSAVAALAYGLAEASIWRREINALRCRAVARLRDLGLGDITRLDSPDARVLILSYGSTRRSSPN